MRSLRWVLLAGAAAGVSACAAPPAAAPTAAPATEAGSPFVADSSVSRKLSPGVRYSALHLASGPWWVHVVEVAPRACGVEYRTVKALDRVVGREPASSMARRTSEALGRPVLATVNADFFSFTPPGVPRGPQISAGLVLTGNGDARPPAPHAGPGRQPVFGVTREGSAFLAEAGLAGILHGAGGYAAPVARVNPAGAADGLTLYTDRFGGRFPSDSGGALAVRVRRLGAHGTVGDTVRGVVAGLLSGDDSLEVREGEVVFVSRGEAAVGLRSLLSAGDTLAWILRVDGVPAAPRELIGGFPMLLRSGRPVQGAVPMDSGFAVARHPRTAVGLRPDGTVLLLVVDGRAPGYSEGMSLDELSRLMQSLGATEALNLDGGGSTTMVLGGTVVNRPSDRQGERSVANALLLLGPRPGTCLDR